MCFLQAIFLDCEILNTSGNDYNALNEIVSKVLFDLLLILHRELKSIILYVLCGLNCSNNRKLIENGALLEL